MVLKDIMSISGEPGLFKFIAQGKNSIIVEELETKKRSSAFASARVSSLDEISVFTEKEEVPLAKVFDNIYEKENGGPAIDYKSDPEKLKAYLGGVLPEYDREKVYVSDIKKMLHWYNILHSLGMLVREEPEKAEVSSGDRETDTPATGKKQKEKKPAGKTAAKKEKTKKETTGESPARKSKGPAK